MELGILGRFEENYAFFRDLVLLIHRIVVLLNHINALILKNA